MNKDPEVGKQKKVWEKTLQKRWLRDQREPGQVYVPEEKAPPARGLEGFELREDGTYVEIGFGPTDATEESEGTWNLDDENVLTLRPQSAAGEKRKIHVVDLTEDKLVGEE